MDQLGSELAQEGDFHLVEGKKKRRRRSNRNNPDRENLSGPRH